MMTGNEKKKNVEIDCERQPFFLFSVFLLSYSIRKRIVEYTLNVLENKIYSVVSVIKLLKKSID